MGITIAATTRTTTMVETIFYTMSVYFMTAGIRKTRWTLPGALAATAAGIGASIVLAGSMA